MATEATEATVATVERTFHKGDALEVMHTFPSHSFDLIYTNPPFDGATQNAWDTVIDWPVFFAEADRLLRPTGNLVLHCSVPFNYRLIRDAPRPPSYSWYWHKENTTCPFLARMQPLRNTEEILVWRGAKGVYYPQRVGTETRTFRSDGASSYYGASRKLDPKTVQGRYQTHHLDMAREIDGFSTRPRAMIRLLYDSYSRAGDRVLDPFCNNALSATCCPGRDWVGIDLFHEPTHLRPQ